MKILNFITPILVILFSILSCSFVTIHKTKGLKLNVERIISKRDNFKNSKKFTNSLNHLIINNNGELNIKILKNNKSTSKCQLSKTDLLLKQAKSYLGTPYRYGGTTRKGIDCSAFVQSSYSVLDINLKRVSSAQALQGINITLDEIKQGDLLFFAQSGNRISHVAIVERVNNLGAIFFIHASSSKGVIITSLDDEYWSKKYKKAVRVVFD